MPSGTIEASLLDIDPCLGCPVPRERTARGRTGGKEQGVPGDSSPCYPRRTNPAPVEEPDIGRGKRQGPSRLVTKTSRQHPPDPTKQPDQDNRIPLCHGGPRRSLAAPTRLHPDPRPPPKSPGATAARPVRPRARARARAFPPNALRPGRLIPCPYQPPGMFVPRDSHRKAPDGLAHGAHTGRRKAVQDRRLRFRREDALRSPESGRTPWDVRTSCGDRRDELAGST